MQHNFSSTRAPTNFFIYRQDSIHSYIFPHLHHRSSMPKLAHCYALPVSLVLPHYLWTLTVDLNTNSMCCIYNIHQHLEHIHYLVTKFSCYSTEVCRRAHHFGMANFRCYMTIVCNNFAAIVSVTVNQRS